ncbi:DUF805 domain-containing protein [Dryocola clanedunensis]
MECYINCLVNFFNGKGRARRKEYWIFSLVNYLIFIMLFLLIEDKAIALIFNTIMFIPSITVSCRRMHDTDRSAWWMLIGIIPILGTIILIIFFCLSGTRGRNRYGNDPKLEYR